MIPSPALPPTFQGAALDPRRRSLDSRGRYRPEFLVGFIGACIASASAVTAALIPADGSVITLTAPLTLMSQHLQVPCHMIS